MTSLTGMKITSPWMVRRLSELRALVYYGVPSGCVCELYLERLPQGKRKDWL